MKAFIVLLGLISCTFALDCNGPACEVIEETSKSIQDAYEGVFEELNNGLEEYTKVAAAQFGDLAINVTKGSQVHVHWEGKLTKESAATLIHLLEQEIHFLEKTGLVTEEAGAKALASAKEKFDKIIAEGGTLEDALLGDIKVKVGDTEIVVHWPGDLTQKKVDGILPMITRSLEMMKKMGQITAEEAEQTLAHVKEEIKKLLVKAASVYSVSGDIEAVVAEVKKALQDSLVILKKAAGKILDIGEARWKAIAAKLDFIMPLIGQGEKWNMLKAKVTEVLAKLRALIAHKIAARTELLLEAVADNILTTFQAVEAQQIDSDGQYMWGRIWEKIKAAIKHFTEVSHAIQVHLLDKYKDAFAKIFKKFVALAGEELFPLVKRLIQDIKKLIKGTGAIVLAIDNDEGKQQVVLAFQDIWNKLMDALRATGKVGAVFAKIFDHYKDQLSHMIHKVAETGLGGIEKIITDMRDDIIKIIKGEHISYEGYGFDEVWKMILDKIRALGKVGDIIAKIFEHYRGQISGIVKKIADTGMEGITKLIDDLKTDIIKIITTGHMLSADGDYDFNSVWETILGAIRKLGKFGDILAKILDHYKDQLSKAIKKLSSQGLGGIEKIITDIRDDIIKIIKGEHITAYELVEMNNVFTDLWNKMIAALQKSKVGTIVAKIFNHYRDQVTTIVKKIAAKGLSGLEKIVIDIKDDIIRIIQGGHVGTAYIDDEDYSFKSVWDKVKEAAKSIGGKVGKVTRAILEKYKDQIKKSLAAIKKIAIDDSMKIVIDIKDDVVRIIEGGSVVATSAPSL